MIQLLCTSRSNYRNKYTSLSFLVFDVRHTISTHCSDKRSRSWARIQRTTEMMKYSSQGQAARVSRELKTSLSTPPERSVPPAGGEVMQTNKKKESEVGLKSRRAKKENAKRWKKRLFLSALCTFSNQSGDNGGGDNSTEAFPPAAYTEDGFRGAKIKISRGETLVWRAPRAPLTAA